MVLAGLPGRPRTSVSPCVPHHVGLPGRSATRQKTSRTPWLSSAGLTWSCGPTDTPPLRSTRSASASARPIAARHSLPVRSRRYIGEVEFGRWEDRSFKTLRRTKLWGRVQRFPSGARFPDGETLREVQVRAVDEMERISAEHPRDAVCCVSHADVIKLVLAHYMGLHIDLFQRLDVGPASVSVITVSGDGPMVHAMNIPSPVGQDPP